MFIMKSMSICNDICSKHSCMVDLVAFDVETLRIDSGCSFKKEFNELIHMNP